MTKYTEIFAIPEWQLADYQGPLKVLEGKSKAPSHGRANRPRCILSRKDRTADRSGGAR